ALSIRTVAVHLYTVRHCVTHRVTYARWFCRYILQRETSLPQRLGEVRVCRSSDFGDSDLLPLEIGVRLHFGVGSDGEELVLDFGLHVEHRLGRERAPCDDRPQDRVKAEDPDVE